MIPTLFLVLLALVIPAFFILIFVMSGYNKLAALRRRCEQTLAELQAGPEGPEHPHQRRNHDEAVSAYDRVRQTFSGRWFAKVFKFAPVKSSGDDAQ